MQWNQIKTLFILCFLVLDVYLLFLFFDKQREADIGVIESQDATIEEQLEGENIIYKDLPEAQPDETSLSVRQKTFTEDDMKLLKGLDKQESLVINENFIMSQFEKPIPLYEDMSDEKMIDLIHNLIIYPNEYEFWDWNETYNVLIFFQKKKGWPVYFNRNGLVLIYLNDKNEMVAYTQAMLGEPEEGDEKKSLIKPIKAIETLYLTNQLNTGEEVTKMNIGYHTMIPLANGVQVFVPTWKVTVNKQRNYFVNAIEGFVFSGDDSDFLEDTFESYIERIQLVDADDDLAMKMLGELKQRLEVMNRGDNQ